MPRFDVTTYGEAVLRLSVPAGQRMETAARFDVDVSGAEANVVGGLSRLGWRCGWVSALPDTPPGRRARHAFRAHGIDLSSVVWRREGRIASYYVEYAHPPRPVKIYYDREDSCFTRLTAAQVDWDYLLDTRHIHLSGVTVPLSENAAEIVKLAMARARQRGVTVSFDINYRKLLWTEAEAREVLLPLSRHVDILFVSRRDAENVFGCRGEPEDVAAQAAELFGARIVVVTLSADGVICREGTATHRLPARPVTVVDRIGAGDAMVAGCLHGWLQGDLELGLRSGAVMAALALSQAGDSVVTDRHELDSLLEPDHADILR